MRSMISAVVVFVCAAALPHAQQPQQMPQEIQFFASIVDAQGKPVPNVKAGDLKGIEDGKAGEILKLEPVEWPMQISIVVDNGPGMTDHQSQLRAGLDALLQALPDGVDVSLYAIAPRPRRLVSSTDRAKIKEGLSLLALDAGAPQLGDAFMELASRFDKDNTHVFPVIVVIGMASQDGSSVKSQELTKVLGTYRKRAATVDVVLVVPPAQMKNAAYQTEVSTGFAKVTGGSMDKLETSNALPETLTKLGQKLAQTNAVQSHQYRITFKRPSATGTGQIGLVAGDGLVTRLSVDGRVR